MKNLKTVNDVFVTRCQESREVCICAAVIDENGCIWRGHRHGDCIALMVGCGRIYGGPAKQGFATSKNRFVTHEEGYDLQIAAGIPSQSGRYRGNWLSDEDLY